MGNRPSRTAHQSLPRPDGVSPAVSVSVSVPETILEGVELESLLPITGSRYAVHLMPAHTEAWVTGPQAASINKHRLLDKHRMLEGYTGYDLASRTYGSQQQPQNASSTFVPVAMPLLSSYVLREQPPKPPAIPGHTAHSSLALLHQRMHAAESADFDETIRVVVPFLSATATSAPPESSTLAVPALPALPAPVSPYVNLRVVPETVVARLAFDGDDVNSVGHAWRVMLALERMLVEDQLLLPRTNSTSTSTFTGAGMGAGNGSGTGTDADVEWVIAQYTYKYAPPTATRTGRLTGANRRRGRGRGTDSSSGGGGGGGGSGSGGNRRSEVWVVLDAANNPRVKAAVDLERRKMNSRAAGSSSGATAHVGASAQIGSSGSLLSARRTGDDNASLQTHPRSVVV